MTRRARKPKSTIPPGALTAKQAQVLMVIDLLCAHGLPPSTREISELFGFASSNAASSHVARLRRKGYLRVGHGHRAMAVTIPEVA